MTIRYLAWLTEHWPTILTAAILLDIIIWTLIAWTLWRNRNRHPLT
jgi:hypothetical protein